MLVRAPEQVDVALLHSRQLAALLLLLLLLQEQPSFPLHGWTEHQQQQQHQHQLGWLVEIVGTQKRVGSAPGPARFAPAKGVRWSPARLRTLGRDCPSKASGRASVPLPHWQQIQVQEHGVQ